MTIGTRRTFSVIVWMTPGLKSGFEWALLHVLTIEMRLPRLISRSLVVCALGPCFLALRTPIGFDETDPRLANPSQLDSTRYPKKILYPNRIIHIGW